MMMVSTCVWGWISGWQDSRRGGSDRRSPEGARVRGLVGGGVSTDARWAGHPLDRRLWLRCAGPYGVYTRWNINARRWRRVEAGVGRKDSLNVQGRGGGVGTVRVAHAHVTHCAEQAPGTVVRRQPETNSVSESIVTCTLQICARRGM